MLQEMLTLKTASLARCKSFLSSMEEVYPVLFVFAIYTFNLLIIGTFLSTQVRNLISLPLLHTIACTTSLPSLVNYRS